MNKLTITVRLTAEIAQELQSCVTAEFIGSGKLTFEGTILEDLTSRTDVAFSAAVQASGILEGIKHPVSITRLAIQLADVIIVELRVPTGAETIRCIQDSLIAAIP
jgi:hypothetical protein